MSQLALWCGRRFFLQGTSVAASGNGLEVPGVQDPGGLGNPFGDGLGSFLDNIAFPTDFDPNESIAETWNRVSKQVRACVASSTHRDSPPPLRRSRHCDM